MPRPPEKLTELVRQFNAGDTLRADFKEDWTRSEYIEPLFSLLGWKGTIPTKLTNRTDGYIREVSQVVTGAKKSPDYAFFASGLRVLYVEAKKPSVNVKTDKKSAYQLRRYTWSAGHSVGVLTDFEEFAVYNGRVQPNDGDDASLGLIHYSTFKEYEDNWDWLVENFSMEAVKSGALARLANISKKRTIPVDAAFLAQIERWRRDLATVLIRDNKGLTTSELNYAVQATIDRIVFLRIAEARGLEKAGELDLVAATHSGAYHRLLELFKRADQRYNSGLFHFRKEKGRDLPDTLTPKLKIDDVTIREIVRSVSADASPYEFSVFPADILGQVYEQFLGRVISADKQGNIEIVRKPDIRKDDGIYYTPTFVVDYIVKTTLDHLLKGKDVADANRLRLLDPACGSGSFLIAVYQHLLDWYLQRYLASRDFYKNEIELGADKRWRLKLSERKRILLNSIFGVDLDRQAVEVAKLSLLLKVIEGETQLEFNLDRLLPDLDQNILQGNALIGPDFYTDNHGTLTEEENQKICAFDWIKGFPSVFENGGRFSAIIGNPPYLSIDDVWGMKDVRLGYFKAAYGDVYNDKTDLLFYFLKKGIDLTSGDVSFIVSRAFLEAYKADKLRGWLGKNARVLEITDLRNAVVFRGVGITTAIVRLTKAQRTGPAVVRHFNLKQLPEGISAEYLKDDTHFKALNVPQKQFASGPWIFASADAQGLLTKIDKAGEPVGKILHIGQGMQTGSNSIFGKRSPEEIAAWKVPEEMYFTRARNSDIRKYHISDSGELILYVEDAASLTALPKGLRLHLEEHRQELEARAACQRGNCLWWQFTWPLHKEHMAKAKILCPYLAQINRFALDDDERFLGLTDTTVLYASDQAEDLRYILGNSKLLTFRHSFIGKLKSGGLREYFESTVSPLPIPRMKPSDKRHKKMVELVSFTEELASRLALARVPQERTALSARLSVAEGQIDELVYALFGLSAQEASYVTEAYEALLG